MTPPVQPVTDDAVSGVFVSVSGEVIMAAIFVVFCLFLIALILFLRANPAFASSNSRFVFAPGSGRGTGSALPRRALDPAVLQSLPVTIFSSADLKDDIECAVCLSELADGDAVRLLPGCHHGFHLKCIDTWFRSNSTCPICRSSVDSKNVILKDLEQSPAINERALQQDTVVSVDGSGEGSSGKSAGTLKIDVENSDSALKFTMISVDDEVKSPVLSSLRSLRRMLSMGGRGMSSWGWDIEQGAPSAASSKEAVGIGLGGEGSSSVKI